MNNSIIYLGEIIEEPTYQKIEETNESYFNIKIKDSKQNIIDIALTGNINNDFEKYKLGKNIEVQVEKIDAKINKAIKIKFLTKEEL